MRAIVQGQSRLRVIGFVQTSPYIIVRAEEIADVTPDGIEVQALMRTVQAQIEQYVANGAPVPPEAAVAARNISEPGLLADMVAYSPDLSTEQRMELLETTDVLERLKIVSNFLGRQIEILELKGKIQSEVKSEMDKTQREYILREQLKAIQRELGEDDPQQAEINELREKVEAAGMPEEVKTRALKEIDRMSRIPSASPEVGVIRTYVDWLIALPWNVSTTDNLDIKAAAKILDEDHYGLEKIKERILEYLAVRSLADTLRSPILAFVGPPGVGKTSLGRVDRPRHGPQVRAHEPGRHPRRGRDPRPPAHLHRRAARPDHPEHQDGRLEQPGLHARRGRQDRHGLPRRSELGPARGARSGAEQHLPGQLPGGAVRPLQGALHHHRQPARPDPGARCATAWRSSSCPATPRQEKIEIGKRFLIPKQMKNHGLTEKHIAITDEAMVELVRSYTHEAGVRNLEREIANVMRKVARAVAEGRKRKTVGRRQEAGRVPRARSASSTASWRPRTRSASATGLVVTEVGGDVIAIEVTLMEGKEDFILTGQLGEVMRESARAGLSWIRAHAAQLGIKREVFEKNTLHIHVPAGGIPKDGPSAGITMATAMVSAFTGIPVRKDVAMTGEITLRGRVLPIGGLKSKILAAHLSGAKIVILPQEEREGSAGHPRGDPQADQARAGRQHGPGPRRGPPAQAGAARRRTGQAPKAARKPETEPEPKAASAPGSRRSGRSAAGHGLGGSGPPAATDEIDARPAETPAAARIAANVRDAAPAATHDPRGATWNTRTTTRRWECRSGHSGGDQEGLPAAGPRASP